jgi:hypothetical protein
MLCQWRAHLHARYIRGGYKVNEMRTLKILSMSLVGVAGLIFLLGISTYWWVPVEAKINYMGSKNICLSGYTSTHRYDFNSKRGFCIYTTVRYSYDVGEKSYSNSFIGFFFPVNISLEKPAYGNISKAYHAPFFSGFSVIKKGVDYFSIGALLFLGWFLFYVRVLACRFCSA